MNFYTLSTIKNDLLKLGLKKSDTLLMHSSFKSIDNLIGGPQALIYSIQEIITSKGTLVMPTQSGDLTDPKEWQKPPVPKELWEAIRKDMLPYDKQNTPTRHIGIVPEIFRNQKNVFRSNHPTTSFSAWGKNAEYIVKNHKYDFPTGFKSPLSKILELNGLILLLGVNHNKSTFLHLAEHFFYLNDKNHHLISSPIKKNSKKKWIKWKELNYKDDDFNLIGEAFEKNNDIKINNVGESPAKLFNAKIYIDFAVDYMKKNRSKG